MQKLLHVRAWACTVMKVSLIQILLAAVFTGLAYAEGTSAEDELNRNTIIGMRNKTLRSAILRIETFNDVRFPDRSMASKNLSRDLDSKSPTSFGEKPILITVTGTITDEQGGPLPGVNIIEKGTQNGTTTDAAGKYSISVADGSSILVFSFIGYNTKEIPVGSSTILNVAMEPDVTTLGEVVVIGYGEREKKDLTGSISNMTSEDIQKSVSLTPELAMQGRMTGVFVSTPGGNPNARPTVRVRGVSTFNNAEPLYVVDGVPILEFGAGSGGGGSQTADIRGNQNVLNLINPGDIESITVLKDASASAIYGSRAANGVVLITTKRGKVGKPVVEFNARRGVQNIPGKFDVLNTEDFTALYRESFDNDYRYRTEQAPTPDPAAPYVWDDPARNYLNVFNPNSTDPYYKYLGNSPTYNWQNELINKDAVIEDYSVRISGGSESTTYYVGAGYSKTESPLIQNYNERYSISANIQTKISDVFEVGLLMRTTYIEALDNTSGSLSQAALVSPWQPIYDPSDPTGFMRSSEIAFEANPDFDLALADPGPAMNVVPGSDQLKPFGVETSSNFFAQMALGKTDYSMLKNFGTAYLQVQPLKGLKIKGGLSIDYTFNKRNDWQHTLELVRFNESGGNPYANQDGTAVGTLRERNSRNISIIPDLTVNYTRSLGDHHVDLLFNASQQDFKYGFNQFESPQSRIEPEFRSIGGANRWNSSLAINQAKAIMGYVGRLSYSFRDKYYLDASLRVDGSSEFAPSQRWGTFPAVSVGWRLSSEDFFTQLTSAFDDLKLRTGYGVLGNSFSQGFGYNSFAYLSTVSGTPDYSLGSGNGDAVGAQRPGATLPNFPNVGLTWEKAKTFNIGLDGALLGSQLTFTVEYYDKNTEGIIQGVPLPANSGISQDVSYNVASVRNSGVEIEVGYNRQFGDVSVGISGNLTTVRNRVTKLHLGIPRYDIGIVEGQSVGFIYGYRVGGIFQSPEEVDAWRAQHEDQSGANPQPGDMWFQDLYGNPTDEEPYKSSTPDSLVNSYDRDVIGKTVPGYYYGFNLSAQYKGFDLGIFFQGVGDVQKYNSARAAGESMGGQGLNLWSTTKDRWTPENPSTTMPRAIFNDPNGNNRYSSRFVESAAFMRLKTVQLGYTLPPGVLESLKVVNRFRVYLMGTNLFTATSWSGIDPENDFVPPTRVISLGLNASF